MAQEIQRKLEETEVKQKELESRGVSVEKALRGEGGNKIFFTYSILIPFFKFLIFNLRYYSLNYNILLISDYYNFQSLHFI